MIYQWFNSYRIFYRREKKNIRIFLPILIPTSGGTELCAGDSHDGGAERKGRRPRTSHTGSS